LLKQPEGSGEHLGCVADLAGCVAGVNGSAAAVYPDREGEVMNFIWYHADHGLSEEHLRQAERELVKHGYGLHVLNFPVETPAPSDLYGPAAGDSPVLDSEVQMIRRGERRGASRMVARPSRPWHSITVVGLVEMDKTLVFTAYGGPIAPREPWDTSMTPAERRESEEFWAEHALAVGA
jgi:hypothetical protein